MRTKKKKHEAKKKSKYIKPLNRNILEHFRPVIYRYIMKINFAIANAITKTKELQCILSERVHKLTHSNARKNEQKKNGEEYEHTIQLSVCAV